MEQVTKVCSHCHIEKSAKFFGRKTTGRLQSWCNDCKNEKRRAKREKDPTYATRRKATQKEAERKRKLCVVCKCEKAFSEFYKKKGGKHGLQPKCKKCQDEYTKNLIAITPGYKEKARAWVKKSNAKNPERTKALMKIRDARYHASSKDKMRERNKKYRDTHPGFTAAANSKRRTRKSNAGGHFNQTQFRDLCARHGNRCLCCGRSDVKLEADHVMPVSRGGSSDILNVQPLCRTCNGRKYVEYIDYRAPFVALAT
jgi:hypothetical protein